MFRKKEVCVYVCVYVYACVCVERDKVNEFNRIFYEILNYYFFSVFILSKVWKMRYKGRNIFVLY